PAASARLASPDLRLRANRLLAAVLDDRDRRRGALNRSPSHAVQIWRRLACDADRQCRQTHTMLTAESCFEVTLVTRVRSNLSSEPQRSKAFFLSDIATHRIECCLDGVARGANGGNDTGSAARARKRWRDESVYLAPAAAGRRHCLLRAGGR